LSSETTVPRTVPFIAVPLDDAIARFSNVSWLPCVLIATSPVEIPDLSP